MHGLQCGALPVVVAVAASVLSAPGAADAADLQSDEIVVFYPSYLVWDARDGVWRGRIRGKVFEREHGAVARARLAALRSALRAVGDRPVEEESTFRARTEAFAVDHERGERVVVELVGSTFPSLPSEENGHFRIPVTLPGEPTGATLSFRTRVDRDAAPEFTGTLTLIEPVGLSVISDIDDTVKRSDVLDREALVANTFFRPYEAIPGMPQLYRTWGEQRVAIHYVTASPWQLFDPLWSFLEEEGFPGVDIRMRHLRLTDVSVVEFFRDSRDFKRDRIREIVTAFPGRDFVLVGDSGENDAEVYAGIARQFPERVRGIFIRAVTGKHLDRSTYRKTFDGIDESRWIVFDQAQTLPRNLAGWLASRGDSD